MEVNQDKKQALCLIVPVNIINTVNHLIVYDFGAKLFVVKEYDVVLDYIIFIYVNGPKRIPPRGQ